MKADIQIKNGKQMAKILKDIVSRGRAELEYEGGYKVIVSSLETLIKVLEEASTH